MALLLSLIVMPGDLKGAIGAANIFVGIVPQHSLGIVNVSEENKALWAHVDAVLPSPHATTLTCMCAPESERIVFHGGPSNDQISL